MKHFLPIALTLVFLLHFAAASYVAYERTPVLMQNDGCEYYELGKNLGETGDFVIRERRYYEPPRTQTLPEGYRIQVFSVIHAGFIACGIPAPLSAALTLALFATLASWLVYGITAALTASGLSAGIALILYQIHPLTALYSVQFGTETAFAAALLLFVYAFTLKNKMAQLLLSAVAAAFAAYVRPTAFLLYPLGCFLWLYLSCRENNLRFRLADWWKILRKPIAYGALCTVLAAPLAIRNYNALGHLTLSGHLGGFNLYIGNNIHNMQAYFSGSGREFIRHQTEGWNNALAYLDSLPENTPPQAAQRELTKRAINDLQQMRTYRAARLFLAKAWHFVRPYPMPGIHPIAQFLFLTVFDCLLYLLAFFGVRAIRKTRLPQMDGIFTAMVAVFLCGLIAHSLVHVYMRHRVPFLIPILTIFAATAIGALFHRIFNRKQDKEQGNEI